MMNTKPHLLTYIYVIPHSLKLGHMTLLQLLKYDVCMSMVWTFFYVSSLERVCLDTLSDAVNQIDLASGELQRSVTQTD